MTTPRILIIQGHPDPAGGHLCHALADAYAGAALEAGHEVHRLEVAQIDFPLLRSEREFNEGRVPASLEPAQHDILWSSHLVFFFPLWLGDMPALLKGFLEQVSRPGFAFERDASNPFGAKALGGRSARVVVTMGMPSLIYRFVFRAHSVKSLERNVLGFVGIAPVHETLIGGVQATPERSRLRWFETMRKLGRAAS